MKYPIYYFRKACFTFLLFLGLISCGKKQESVFPVEEKITSSVYASGTIKSVSQYEVYSKVNGIIDQILVKEGALVKNGQAIYKLSNKTQELNFENAKLLANYSSENANHEKLNQAQTEMEVAKLKLDNDLSLLERQKKLWAGEIGTKNEVEQRELAYKNSMALFNASKLKLNDLKKQIEFQSKQTEKSAAISSTSMNDYIVKSEIAGRVYSLSKEKGEMINTQSPVAIIGDANKFYIELQVDEYDISKLKKGQKTIVAMDSYKGQTFEAIIEKIYPLMNDKTKSFKVDALFTSQPANLFPNLSAQANIVIEVKEKVLTIPRAYLIDNEFVYLANKEKRKVKTGLMDYEKAEIVSGLTSKDAIVKSIQ
jgi:multidrug efflux pump subunit AcrA (membrane-fusion protein)